MARFKNGNLVLENEKSVVSGSESLIKQSRNVIINPGFTIRQRISSPISDAGGTSAEYGIDRWKCRNNTDGELLYSWANDAPSSVPALQECLVFQCETVSSVTDSADFVVLQQFVEGYNFREIAGKIVTMSFWVKSNKTGIYCAFMRSPFGTDGWVAEYTINSASTWEYKTITVDLADYTGEQDYTTGTGITIGFSFKTGSDHVPDPLESWSDTGGAFVSSTDQVNFLDNISNDFRLTGVQVEIGSQATETEIRDYEIELALCQRYFASVAITDDYTVGVSAASLYRPYKLPVTMRTSPTVSVLSQFTYYSGGGGSNFTPSAFNALKDMVTVRGTGLTNGNGLLAGTFGADADI